MHSFVVDTKTILNSEMKTIFNSLRIIGVKTHWIFAQVKRSKTWGLLNTHGLKKMYSIDCCQLIKEASQVPFLSPRHLFKSIVCGYCCKKVTIYSTPLLR